MTWKQHSDHTFHLLSYKVFRTVAVSKKRAKKEHKVDYFPIALSRCRYVNNFESYSSLYFQQIMMGQLKKDDLVKDKKDAQSNCI